MAVKVGYWKMPSAGSETTKAFLKEKDYPYVAEKMECQITNTSFYQTAKITGFQFVPPKNETALKWAVSRQPVSAAADTRGWREYLVVAYPGQLNAVQIQCRITQLQSWDTENGRVAESIGLSRIHMEIDGGRMGASCSSGT